VSGSILSIIHKTNHTISPTQIILPYRVGKQNFCTMVSKCMYCAAVVVAPMHELLLFWCTLTPNARSAFKSSAWEWEGVFESMITTSQEVGITL